MKHPSPREIINMRNFKLLLLFTLTSVNTVKSQKIELQGGLNFQTTIMNFVNFDYIKRYGSQSKIPYNYERNIQGLGLDLATIYRLNDNGLRLRYQLQGRYDETYFELVNSKTKPVRKIIGNHSLELLKDNKYGTRYTSFGIQVFNPFIQIPFREFFEDEDLKITFIGYSVGKGFLFGKNNENDLCFRAYYVSSGDIPFFNDSNGYLTYSVSLKRRLYCK